MSSAPAAFAAGRLERLGIEPDWSRSLDVTFGDGTPRRVHALDAAPGDGHPPPLTVVCVHGNPTWSLMWRSFHRRLGDRYRVLAVDQLSMGLSERTGPRVFAQRVDDLGRILDAFAVEGTVVSLLRAGRIKGVNSGLHKCTEVGDMVASELRSAEIGRAHV